MQERQSIAAQLKNYQHENDNLREQLEEEAEGKAELQRHISKLNGEIQQWRARFESEGLSKVDEIEDAKWVAVTTIDNEFLMSKVIMLVIIKEVITYSSDNDTSNDNW